MKINIKNCNNIKNADIAVEKNSLNIKYGMNGTGKSTIAKAIEKREHLSELKTFGSNLEPEISISENISKVEIFNNDFINRITFNGSEVIENGFEVFGWRGRKESTHFKGTYRNGVDHGIKGSSRRGRNSFAGRILKPV